MGFPLRLVVHNFPNNYKWRFLSFRWAAINFHKITYHWRWQCLTIAFRLFFPSKNNRRTIELPDVVISNYYFPQTKHYCDVYLDFYRDYYIYLQHLPQISFICKQGIIDNYVSEWMGAGPDAKWS